MLLSIFLCHAAYAASVSFLHVPSDVHLPADNLVASSDLPAIDLALLGIDSNAPLQWSNAGSLWRRPEAIVVFNIVSPTDRQPTLKALNSYPLQEDTPVDFSNAWMTIQQVHADASPVLVETSVTGVSGTSALDDEDQEKGGSDPALLDVSQSAERTLQKETAAVEQLEGWLARHPSVQDGTPDFYVINFEALSWLDDSPPALLDNGAAALNNISSTIERATQLFRQVYKDNCVVQAVSTSGSRSRQPRLTKKKLKKGRRIQGNLAIPLVYKFSDANYSVVFNICLWLVIGLAITILYVAVSMWNMDPGKESIVYRMTMTRAKKD